MDSPQLQPNQPSEHDTELLSAYLDHHLSISERAGLDQRLAQEPALRTALAELRATQQALRGLEALPPPRSFTLDPATVRPRRAWFFAPWVMQFGGSLAAIFLMVVALLQLGGGQVSVTFSQISYGLDDGAITTAPPMIAASEPAPEVAAPMSAQIEVVPAAGATLPPASAAAPAAALPLATPPAQASERQSDGIADPFGGADTLATDGTLSAPTAPMAAAAPAPAPSAQPSPGLPLGLALALCLLLLGLGVGWYVARQRR